MADERNEWLDGKAAEQLLRGEPVEVLDEHARAQAARLLRALNQASGPEVPVHPEDGEMPGEAAALAAFRKARADGAAGESLGTVRLGTSTCSSLGARLRRPVRFGIAAAVAGCALGGVAVAAGTGLLPSPFGAAPLPGSSVSAAATPGPVVSDTPSGGTLAPPAETPDPLPSPSPTPSESDSLVKDPDPSSSDSGPGGSGTDEGGTDKDKDGRKAELYRKTVEACREYRDGTIAPERKKRLEIAARGPGRVERFCEKLLSGEFGSGTEGNGGSEGGGDPGGPGEGGSDDGGSDPDGGGHTGGSKPHASWQSQRTLSGRSSSENIPLPSVGVSLHSL